MNQTQDTVHHAITRAVAQSVKKDAETPSQPMTLASFRIPEDLRSAASEICKAHGIDLSKYCRACVEILVSEYLPEQPQIDVGF